jgi:hypothetical protein
MSKFKECKEKKLNEFLNIYDNIQVVVMILK